MHSSSVRRGVTSDPSPPNLRGTASNPLPRIWKLRHTGYDVTQMCFTSSRCSLRRTREARVWGIQGFKVSRIPSWAVVGIAWRCLWCAGCTLGPAIWGRAYGLVPHFLLGFKFLLLIIVFDKFSRVWEGSSGGLSGRFRPFFGGDVTGLGFCLGCSHMILLFGMMVYLGFGFYIYFWI